MDKDTKEIVILLFVLIGVMISFYFSILVPNSKEWEARGNACKELGFEDDEYEGGFTFCEDLEGNLHHIKMDCDGYFNPKCSAKLISVGDVRTLKGSEL